MSLSLRVLACLFISGLAVGGLAPAAAAHPFGPPSTARVSVDGANVAVTWLAAEDDWVALGQSLGAFEDPSTGAVSVELTGEQKLQRSSAVRDYLLSRVAVTRDGMRCPGRLEPLERLLADGARFVFECPGPVVDADITVEALTDLNASYRTMITADTPATPDRALLTAARATQRMRFTSAGTSSGVMSVALSGSLGAVGVAALGAIVLVRRRRRPAVAADRRNDGGARA
ncbi:hypothetical protein [Microtetraspora glauca]|uniref:LPXTG cell wall anchor domain-containing protein n=1 Tax=Microtetraspora glauca TaxID=1996 RepID=A0ABV3GI26_MICGL